MFSREHQQTVLKPLIDQMQALVVGFGVPSAAAEIDSVRQQLRLAESAGVRLEQAATTRRLLEATAAAGWSDAYYTAVIRTIEKGSAPRDDGPTPTSTTS